MTNMLLSSRSLARRLRPSISIATNPLNCNGDRFVVASDVTSVRFLSSATSSSTDITSGRLQFKNVPVNPSILSYIQYVGVGIPKKSKRRPRRRQPGEVLSEKDEEDHFRQQIPYQKPSIARRPPPPFVAPSSSKDTTETGQIIQRFPVKMIGSSGSAEEEFPRPFKGLPEVAIAGRSNVGKSTLLNALLYGNPASAPSTRGRRHARSGGGTVNAKLPRGLKAATSPKPGETRRLSFYQLSAKVDSQKMAMLLVDLPGYGFAYASPEQAEKWKALMESYILDRGNPLKRVLFLVDARHGMKKADIDFLETLQASLYEKRSGPGSKLKRELPPIQIVLTKCDLVNQSDLARRVVLVRRQLSDCLIREPSALPIMMVSAKVEGQRGVVELQKELAALVPLSKDKPLLPVSNQSAEKQTIGRASQK